MKKLTFYLSIIAASAVTMAAEIVEVSSTSPIFFLTPLEIILLIIFFLLLVIAIIKNRRMYFVSDKYHKKTVNKSKVVGKAKHFRSHYESHEKKPTGEEHIVVENPAVSVNEVDNSAVDRIIESQKEFVDELKHLNFDSHQKEVIIREEPHVQPVVAPQVVQPQVVPQYVQPVAVEKHESKPRVIIKKTPMNFFFGKKDAEKKTTAHKKHKAHKPTKKRINWRVHVPFLKKVMKNTLSHHNFEKEAQTHVPEYNPNLGSKDKQLWQSFSQENYLPNENDFKSFSKKKDMWPEVNHFNSAFFKNKKNKVYVDDKKNIGVGRANKKKGVIKYLNSVYYD